MIVHEWQRCVRHLHEIPLLLHSSKIIRQNCLWSYFHYAESRTIRLSVWSTHSTCCDACFCRLESQICGIAKKWNMWGKCVKYLFRYGYAEVRITNQKKKRNCWILQWIRNGCILIHVQSCTGQLSWIYMKYEKIIFKGNNLRTNEVTKEGNCFTSICGNRYTKKPNESQGSTNCGTYWAYECTHNPYK